MNRKKIQRQLSAYLDRELNEGEKLVVERYLSGCQKSAATFENGLLSIKIPQISEKKAIEIKID